MTAEEGEKNFPRDEEPFLDDEKNRKAVYTLPPLGWWCTQPSLLWVEMWCSR